MVLVFPKFFFILVYSPRVNAYAFKNHTIVTSKIFSKNYLFYLNKYF
ncbi:hypothetical protein QMU_2508, partial [Clostridioides difficile DA00310]